MTVEPESGALTPPRRGWRPRRWQLAALVLAGSLVALVLAAVTVGVSVVAGVRQGAAGRQGAPVVGEGVALVAEADSDTAVGRLGPPPAEWREQVALGWAQVRARPEVAADHFRRAILLEDARAEAWRGLGIALLGLDDREGAQDALCTARARGRRASAELERVLRDEHLACPSPGATPRTARTPSP